MARISVESTTEAQAVDRTTEAQAVDRTTEAQAVDRTTAGPGIRTAIDALPPHSWGRSDAAGAGVAPRMLLELAANEGPYGPFPAATAAAARQIEAANRYPESGFRSLRHDLAQHLDVDLAEVAVGAGGVGLIHHLSVALLDEGSNICTCSPTFHAYALDARKQGAFTRTAPVRDDGSFDLQAMADLIDDRTRIVYVCNPNNPTGGIVGRKGLLDFVDTVPSSVTIVIDEAYFEYARSAGYPDTIADRAFARPNVVTLRTFSKAYGLAGLRVAYLVGAPGLVAAVQKVQNNYEVTSVALAAARASLCDTDELARRIQLNTEGRNRLAAALRSLGFEPLDSHGNFVYLRPGDGTAFADALEGEGVVVRPADAMGDPSGVRITVGTPDQVTETIDAVARLVRKKTA